MACELSTKSVHDEIVNYRLRVDRHGKACTLPSTGLHPVMQRPREIAGGVEYGKYRDRF